MNAYYVRQIDVEKKRLHVGPRVQCTMQRQTATSLCAGDLRLRKILNTLNSLGIVRSVDQCVFHDAFLQACLPKIYGSDWNSNSVRVMREFNLKEIRYETLVMTPRRYCF